MQLTGLRHYADEQPTYSHLRMQQEIPSEFRTRCTATESLHYNITP